MTKIEFVLVGQIEHKESMERYMRNHFPFLGVKSQDRKKQSKALIKESKKLLLPDLLDLVDNLYMRDEREYQYVAIDLCVANEKRFSFSDMQHLAMYVDMKPWWDSVDAWRKVFGLYIKRQPDDKKALFELFYRHTSFWMRRVSIILQLNERELTDTELLTKSLDYDLNTDEFFIQKAIGWALRQYSKVNPHWVETYIEKHELSALAVREGSKYL